MLPCEKVLLSLGLIRVSVRGADVPVDGETEVWRELQPPPSADGETRRTLRQRAEDRPAHGFPQRVLRPSQTAGTNQHKMGILYVM